MLALIEFALVKSKFDRVTHIGQEMYANEYSVEEKNLYFDKLRDTYTCIIASMPRRAENHKENYNCEYIFDVLLDTDKNNISMDYLVALAGVLQ